VVDLFVYGTLTNPDRVAGLVDSFSFLGAARVDGLRIVSGAYPTLAPGGSAAGRLLRVADVDPIDRYERVADGLYVRASLPRADGDAPVAVYVGDPDALCADVTWPGEGPLADRVARYVDAHDVVVAPTS
jgi:gamma-glutamylcyclotransferase (GGCT)/AIG2-like uncharacterized protein YtfP